MILRTFKLVGLKIEQEGDQEKTLKEIPLEGGLVLNKEDGENSWLIEALVSTDYQPFFEKYLKSQSTLRAFVTISKKGNSPAQIVTRVKTITPLERHLSVLLGGRLVTSKLIHDPEELLGSLLEEGLSGESLLKAFSDSVHQRKETMRL
jgi:YwpF-like protein